MESYELDKSNVLGQGTFGIVYAGKIKATGEPVAVKKLRMGDLSEGISFTALREIGWLQEVRHPNVIKLTEVFVHGKNAYLVFEMMLGDLEMLIKDEKVFFSAGDIKSYMKMLLEGIEHLHKNWLLHRDLKPSNLLINSQGVLKIGDFGLARAYGSPDQQLTSTVVTRWYRAPELLYGARSYGYGVDIWAIGCIFAEIMKKEPFLPGESDLGQLRIIFDKLGVPTQAQWPGMTLLPDYVPFNPQPGIPLNQLFTAASAETLDLLGKMFKFDPSSRCTATEALNSAYFKSNPPPTPPEKLPKPTRKKEEAPQEKKRPAPSLPPGINGESFAKRKLDL